MLEWNQNKILEGSKDKNFRRKPKILEGKQKFLKKPNIS